MSPKVAEGLPAIVEKLNLSPIRYVVNSHYHNDHIRGNQAFDEDVDIISTRRTAELIRIKEPQQIELEKSYAPSELARYDSLLNAFEGDTSSREYLSIMMWQPYYELIVESFPILKTRFPNVFVDDEKLLEGTERVARLISFGKGHTESDLILYLPGEKIVFTGDLVFNGMHPYLGSGALDALKASMDSIQNLGVEKVVPGHGPVGSIEDLDQMKAYVDMVVEVASGMNKEGKSPEDASMIPIPEPFTDWWFGDFFPWNIEFAMASQKDTIEN
jgi:glyoxylase-like metal-dependent hydrolase (beta-lactamase superfamily II)